jgi:hypothetical protein
MGSLGYSEQIVGEQTGCYAQYEADDLVTLALGCESAPQWDPTALSISVVASKCWANFGGSVQIVGGSSR